MYFHHIYELLSKAITIRAFNPVNTTHRMCCAATFRNNEIGGGATVWPGCSLKYRGLDSDSSMFKWSLCRLASCVCSGFMRTRQQVYLIEPLGQSEDGDHAVYRREHLKVSGSPGCGSSSNTSTTLYDRDQGPPLASLFRSRSWVGDVFHLI